MNWDTVSGFRLEMSTIYLGFNIEYLTFKMNVKYPAFLASARFVYMMWAHLSTLHKYPAHLLTQMTFRNVQRSV